MPPEAASNRIDGQQWTLTEELIAVLVERVDVWGLYQARLQTAPKHQEHLPKESLRLPRPGEAAQQDEVITDAAEIARWFGS